MENVELVKINPKSEMEVDDILDFLRNAPCQLLKTGFRPVEMKYYFCSCDPEMKEPICQDCRDRCHKDHTTIKSEELSAICTCGMKCHSTRNESETINQDYEIKCYFHEFSELSNTKTYYESLEQNAKPICQFCFNFCQDSDKGMSERNALYIKKNAEVKVPECKCGHNNHMELKFIYGKIKQISTEVFQDLDFGNFTRTHLVNLLLLSTKTFDNVYSPLIKCFDTLNFKIMEGSYNFEEFYLPTCDFILALESIAKISTKCKRLTYFHSAEKMKDAFPDVKTLCQILEKKFDHKVLSIWNLKSNLMTLFLKFMFKKEFNMCPNFKVIDIENLNPFQRLMRVKDSHAIKSHFFGILDNFLTVLSKLNHIKDKQPETYSVIYRVYQVCKFFAKFCLFTNEQLHKFCNINDELIFNFSEATKGVAFDLKRRQNMIDYQFHILSPMVKSIRYLIFHYNDQYVESFLKGEVTIDKVHFFHSTAELSKYLGKNAINVMTFLRYFKKNELDLDKDAQLHKILSQATKVIAMNMNNPDYYSVGMERLFDKNNEIYMKYLANVFDHKEKAFVDYLKKTGDSLETFYQSYFEFKMPKNDLNDFMVNLVKEFFDTAGLSQFQPKYHFELTKELNLRTLGNEDDVVVVNKNGEKRKISRRKTNPNLSVSKIEQEILFTNTNVNHNNNYSHKYKILMNKSFYLYTVMKIISINELEHQSEFKTNENFKMNEILFNSIMKLLAFYVEDNVDNCVNLLSSDFEKLFTSMHGEQLYQTTELLEHIVISLMKARYEFSSNYTILKLIEIISKKVSNNPEMLETLERVINVINVVLRIGFINHEHTYEKLRQIVKDLYAENPVFVEYKNFLGSVNTGSRANSNRVLNSNSELDDNNNKEILIIDRLITNNQSLSGYDIAMLKNTFKKFLQIMTYLFDGDATLNEMDFLLNILKAEEVPKILIKKDLDLSLRLEIIKLFRIIYVDVVINSERIDLYRNLIINPPKPLSEEDGIDSNEVFKLYEELININESKIGNMLSLDSAILKYELKYFLEFIESNKQVTYEKIIEYIEEGIILPLMVHLNKFMSILYVLEMEEILKLYEMVFYFLRLKEYVMTNKHLLKFKENSDFKLKNIFKNKLSMSNNDHMGLIKLEFTEEQLEEVRSDLDEMNSQHFEVLNFQTVFGIFEKHLDSFIYKPRIRTLKKIFQKKDYIYSEEKIEKMKNTLVSASWLKTEYERKVFDMIIKYANDKNKLSESVFIQCLEEENSFYSMKYRSLLVRALLFLVNDPKSAERYRRISLWTLFRLLQFDTSATQKSVYELYEQHSDLLNLHEMVNLFFTNFVSILFTSCNPSTITMNFDYYTAITIIKILKYLCEEHNPMFQKIFFQDIKYKFVLNEYQANYGDYKKNKTQQNSQNVTPSNSSNMLIEIKPNSALKKRKSLGGNKNISNNKLSQDVDIDNDNNTNLNKSKTSSQEIGLFDFMLTILSKIIFLAGWEKVELTQDEKNISYYYDIFFVTVEFLIEMIQGTERSNLLCILKSSFEGEEEEAKHFLEFLSAVKPLLFSDKNNSKILLNVRKDIMDFLMAFLEEKSTPVKLVTMMANVLHPNNVMETIGHVMKKLYIKVNNLDKSYSEIEFNNDLCEYFSDIYFKDVKFCENEEFELANRMYQYIKLLATNEKYSQEDAINIIDSVNKHNIEKVLKSYHLQSNKGATASGGDFLANSDMVFDDAFYQNYFCVRFFEKVTRTVLVQLEGGKENGSEENLPVRVIFTLNPLTRYLSQNTKEDFYEKVNRDGRYIKLFTLIEQSDQFYDEIKYNSERDNAFLTWVSAVNYYWFEVFAFLITLTINVYMVAVLDHSEVDGGDTFNSPAINGLAYLHLAFNSLVLIIWFYSKFKLYFIIERKKYLEKKKREELNCLDAVMVFFNAVIMTNKINVFLWNVFFSAIGVSRPGNGFVYSVQLFSIMNLSETLKNIIRSVTMKYKQVAATMMLMFIVCYIFASIAFFYFSEDFVYNMFDPENPLVPSHAENICGTLIYCFITHVDIGMRWDGGIGEYLNKRTSFTYDPRYYVGRFFYEDISFIFVNFIILSIIFGIIIDAFAELRDRSLRYDNDKKNVCFICGATREQLEKKCINFNEHIEGEHNVWIYVDYMIGLKFVDVQETNAINSYVCEQVEKKQIAWFPCEEDEGGDEKEEEHDEEGEEDSEASANNE